MNNSKSIQAKNQRRDRGGKFTDENKTRIPSVKVEHEGKGIGDRVTGSKFKETEHMTQAQVGRLMRHDITLAQKNGEIPKGWKVSIRQAEGAGVTGFRASITAPRLKDVYRPVSHTDLEAKPGSTNQMAAHRLLIEYSESHPGPSHDEGFDRYCRERFDETPGSAAYTSGYTDQALASMDTVRDICDQYGLRESDPYTDHNGDHHETLFDGIGYKGERA